MLKWLIFACVGAFVYDYDINYHSVSGQNLVDHGLQFPELRVAADKSCSFKGAKVSVGQKTQNIKLKAKLVKNSCKCQRKNFFLCDMVTQKAKTKDACMFGKDEMALGSGRVFVLEPDTNANYCVCRKNQLLVCIIFPRDGKAKSGRLLFGDGKAKSGRLLFESGRVSSDRSISVSSKLSFQKSSGASCTVLGKPVSVGSKSTIKLFGKNTPCTCTHDQLLTCEIVTPAPKKEKGCVLNKTEIPSTSILFYERIPYKDTYTSCMCGQHKLVVCMLQLGLLNPKF